MTSIWNIDSISWYDRRVLHMCDILKQVISSKKVKSFKSCSSAEDAEGFTSTGIICISER